MKLKQTGNLFIFLCLAFTIGSKAQSLSKLDSKRSFKDFKLGDTYQQWASDLKLIKEDNLYKQYQYLGDCCKTIFDNPIGNIGLIFKNNKLIFILVETNNETSTNFKRAVDEYDFINESFEMLFGKPTSYKNDDFSGESLYSWQTKKTVLSTKFESLGYSNGFNIRVIIADRDYFTNKIQDGF